MRQTRPGETWATYVPDRARLPRVQRPLAARALRRNREGSEDQRDASPEEDKQQPAHQKRSTPLVSQGNPDLDRPQTGRNRSPSTEEGPDGAVSTQQNPLSVHTAEPAQCPHSRTCSVSTQQNPLSTKAGGWSCGDDFQNNRQMRGTGAERAQPRVLRQLRRRHGASLEAEAVAGAA